MSIKDVVTNVTGLASVEPRVIYIQTTDTLAEITATGYLNKMVQNGLTVSNLDMALVSGTDIVAGSAGDAWFAVQVSGGNTSLVEAAGGGVALPVVANHIATFVGTSGEIGDNAATAINGGNIQAGLSGTAGYLAAFPATAAKGSLHMVAVANTGDTVTTISNAAMGQASVVSIPDPAAATANFAVAPAALVSGNLIQASGTAGLVADAGVAPAALQLKANIKAVLSGNIGGAGAGPLTVTVAGMTAASVVVVTVSSSSNPCYATKAVAGSGSFALTMNADPGASLIINYIAFIAAQ
jgi:hypothetical protein